MHSIKKVFTWTLILGILLSFLSAIIFTPPALFATVSLPNTQTSAMADLPTSFSSVNFQIISDIHVEFPRVVELLPREALEPAAPYLVLLGDIGYPTNEKYKNLLLNATEKFKKVFVLAGNHEYYNTEYNACKQLIRDICSEGDNLIFMDKTSLLVDGIRVLGTTLWSHIPPEVAATIASGINDYHKIRVKDPNTGEVNRLTVAQSVAWFNDEVEWLKSEIALAKEEGEKVVVFTHHAPSTRGTSHPRFDGSPNNAAFSTNLEHLMGDPVVLWCFGHTHYSSDQVIKGTRLVSNQVGYISMAEKSGFEPGKVVSVPF